MSNNVINTLQLQFLSAYVGGDGLAGIQSSERCAKLTLSILSGGEERFSFYSTTLALGAVGNVPFTFINSSSIPPGSYDVHFKTDSSDTINDASVGFVLTDIEPADGDAQSPAVRSSSRRHTGVGPRSLPADDFPRHVHRQPDEKRPRPRGRR